MVREFNKNSFKNESKIFKTLGHPIRLWIVNELSGDKEYSAAELAKATEIPVATVSKHLSILKRAGILDAKKREKTLFYHLQSPSVLKMISCIGQSDFQTSPQYDVADFQLLIDQMPVYLYAEDIDNDFRHVLCNKACEILWNRSHSEIIGKSDRELFSNQEEIAKFRLTDEEVAKSDNLLQSTLPVTGENGQQRIFNFYRKKVDLSNNRHWLFGLAIDNTEQYELSRNQQTLNLCFEDILKRGISENQVESVLKALCLRLNATRCYLYRHDWEKMEVVPEGEYLTDSTRSTLDSVGSYPFNPEAVWVKMLENGDIIGSHDMSLPEVARKFGIWSYVHAKYGVQSLYGCRVMVNGKIWGNFGITYEQSIHYLSDQEKSFFISAAHLLGMMIERQLEHKDLENTMESLRAMMEQAQSAARAKSLFLATMSHEIRTPLNSVIGFSELLKDNTISNQIRTNYLDGITIAGNALLSLINDILDLSKLEADRMIFTPIKTSFADLFSEMTNMFLQKCDAKKIKISSKISNDFPVVFVDKLRIGQLLFNLVGNAVKFTMKGSITLKAEFFFDSADEGTIVLKITDTGIGISQKEQNQIFDMFTQTSTIRGTQLGYTGTGLGLALCQRMVQKMNGEIQVKSELDKGSEFSVILPHIKYQKNSKCAIKKFSGLSEPITKVDRIIKVLLVDDVALNLKVESAMLEKIGLQVEMAHNVDEALAMIDANSYDYILTDLWMPGMNGAELARKIRHLHKTDKIRIVVVTADIEITQNISPSIFDAVLIKPITLEKLRAVFN